MTTKQELQEDDDYELEEAMRYAIKERKYLIGKATGTLSRVGVRYMRRYLGTGIGTWELARYRYRYRYMIFTKYLGTGTGTGTHEKDIHTGTFTLYDDVTKN